LVWVKGKDGAGKNFPERTNREKKPLENQGRVVLFKNVAKAS